MYTKKGDTGKTFLFGGKRVFKDNPRVEAYGTVDELNSWIGFSQSICKDNEIKSTLKEIQRMLFVAGADLASPFEKEDTPRIKKEDTERIEKIDDQIFSKLPRLTKFILPAGTMLSSSLHISRTVCRRAERKIVTLSKKEKINPELIPFINRLSTLLFNLARLANQIEKVEDEIWDSQSNSKATDIP